MPKLTPISFLYLANQSIHLTMNGLIRMFNFAALIAVVFLTTACPGVQRSGQQDQLKKIQENNMNLPELKLRRYQGIEFMLSDFFRRDYDESYVLTDNAMTRLIDDIEVYFSVEIFTNDDAEVIQYSFDEELSPLDAVHDNYVLKREDSVFEPSVSIKKEVPKEVAFDGYIQVVHGANSSYSERSSYFIATLKVGIDYYVFQMIGKEENMGYLHDDFLEIIRSVQK